MNTINMNINTWNIEDLTGYKPISTFYEDFSIADHYGKAAVRRTYDNIFREWKGDYRYLTELVMALNWKIWEHYDADRIELASLYNTLWMNTADYTENTLKGDELQYYYRTID